MFNFLRDYFLGKGLNLLEKQFKKMSKKNQEMHIKNFYSVLNSKEYREFEYELLKKYYGLDFFTEVNNHYFPAFSVLYEKEDTVAINGIRDFDDLTLNKDELKVEFNEDEHQKYKKNL